MKADIDFDLSLLIVLFSKAKEFQSLQIPQFVETQYPQNQIGLLPLLREPDI
jgi:hypothetical protein